MDNEYCFWGWALPMRHTELLTVSNAVVNSNQGTHIHYGAPQLVLEAVNAGIWCDVQRDHILTRVREGVKLTSIARELVRSPYAIVIQLNDYITRLIRNDEMQDLDLGQDDSLEGINLQITMPELVDASMAGLIFYSIVLKGEGVVGSKGYTFKSFEKIPLGATVTVGIKGKRSIMFGEVVQVLEDQPNNYGSVGSYSWILGTVNEIDVAICKTLETKTAQAIKGNQHNNLRQNMLDQLTNFKAPTLADLSKDTED